MGKMSKELKKLDRIVRTKSEAGHDELNVSGGLAFQSTPQASLYRQIATSLWSGDGYYEKREDWHLRFVENVARSLADEKKFAFQLAAFGRDRSGLSLRTSPVALYAEASTHSEAKGTGIIREYAPKVLFRADDPNEAIAYLRRYHKSIPHGVLRGIADTLPKFDAYQLAKYKQTGQMRDVLRLARPKPKDEEQEALWGATVADKLPIPYTWETELSKAHMDEEKRAVWNELLANGKLGIFALLRNVRNILKVQADIEMALEQFTEERIKNSGILPFQIYKAFNAVRNEGHTEIAEQLLKAVEWSVQGIEKLRGRTLVVADNSGSMSSYQTRGMETKEIANLMAAMALNICEDGIAGTFGETFAIANAHSNQSLFENKKQIDYCGQHTGHSTNAFKIFRTLTYDRILVDRVIILSDMQCYDGRTAAWNKMIGRHVGLVGGRSMAGELEAYRQSINPNIIVYTIDLASQDNSTQFAENQPVIDLAGFSDSIFRFMSAMEAGDDVLDRIRKDY